MLALHELEAWPGDWRADVTKAGCAWVAPILEEGLRTDDTQAAIDAILARAQAPDCASPSLQRCIKRPAVRAPV
ncbi:TPA: hypothetical protein HH295_00930 [Xanthomonas vasicola pv. zeae]|uniref:Uncharacterized protein n=3 Tax=Xanthomonas vasicola TaxID=56459 RepID=A0A836P0X7_XANVA|nr:hypothetical protein C7V42_14410 [Xanthomonas vasicola pv. vasculorum]AZR24818.1 hypothetical protein NX81_008895 [Xanthomonas vasicola]AZR28968.1 hypothetical protein NX80_009935 [Xanthomonas vasicola pv. arecae]AZR32872.1 hypothetical protein KWO_007930 [Xanthomonas vasicola pv. musacearum NCPPB 4379]KEZ98950.1 hypothetical protein A11M_0103495 [Xanthomonas vasicola pv. vasculorum NCPPB 895]KFA07620.1 hypothetical protein KWM_0114470 [Xanthomonas vasicola pv. musacearum NCPPB 2005]KFA098